MGAAPAQASPRGIHRRRDVDESVGALNRLRNRAAHHEHLRGEDLTARHHQLLALAGLLSPELGQHLYQVSPAPRALSRRPTWTLAAAAMEPRDPAQREA